jgi:probable F420-dependent oxidoreductase
MDLGTLGVWTAVDRLDAKQLKDYVQLVERLGYGTLWYPESIGYETLSVASYMLAQTSRLNLGSSIANIYARDAITARNGLKTLSTLSGDRFVLGLGVSHVPNVEGVRDHTYGKPVATMRAYLARIREDEGAIGRPHAIAALGPKMLELSAEMSWGALPYNVTPDHTAMAKGIVGGDAWLAVEQKVLLETDADRARAMARRELARYMPLDNYRNNWLRQGYTSDDFEDGGSDRLMDGMVVWGTEDDIRQRLQEHVDAGATHVAIQPVWDDGDFAARDRMLEIFAPRT